MHPNTPTVPRGGQSLPAASRAASATVERRMSVGPAVKTHRLRRLCVGLATTMSGYPIMRRRLTIQLALALVLLPTLSWGYCRQYSCQDDEANGVMCQRDEHDCIVEGNMLHYTSPCLKFGVAQGQAASLGLTDESFAAIVEQAFARWQNVDCGGGRHPGLQVRSVGVIASDEPYFCDAVELNLSVWFLEDMWVREPDALGYTVSVYAEDDAEVFDADVLLNLGKITEDLQGEATDEVLLSIITHEAGHFLGLAHSDDAEAVMAATYSRRDLRGRELTQDDINGVCEIFPPRNDVQCDTPSYPQAAIEATACENALDPSGGGCSIARGVGGAPRERMNSFVGARGGSWWWLGFAALLCRSRRRRPR